MKEFVEKLINKLEEAKFPITDLKVGVVKNGIQQTDDAVLFSRAKEIVNQLAEEYNNGWIPCSEDKPKKNGWYECWYMTSAVGENKYYEPITLYWEDNIWLYRPNKFTMPTQSNVVAWKPIAPYQPKGE